jgi:hypothetical protein
MHDRRLRRARHATANRAPAPSRARQDLVTGRGRHQGGQRRRVERHAGRPPACVRARAAFMSIGQKATMWAWRRCCSNATDGSQPPPGTDPWPLAFNVCEARPRSVGRHPFLRSMRIVTQHDVMTRLYGHRSGRARHGACTSGADPRPAGGRYPQAQAMRLASSAASCRWWPLEPNPERWRSP